MAPRSLADSVHMKQGLSKDFFQQQCHLVTIFNFPKMKPKITKIDLRLLERSLYAAIFAIVKIHGISS